MSERKTMTEEDIRWCDEIGGLVEFDGDDGDAGDAVGVAAALQKSSAFRPRSIPLLQIWLRERLAEGVPRSATHASPARSGDLLGGLFRNVSSLFRA